MPFIYVYALSDFTTPIPDEIGAQAVGTPPFTVTTGPTLTRITLEITDNDTVLDEIDASQTLTSTITIDGTTYNAGDRVFANYILDQEQGGGPEIYSITIGGTNSGQNTTSLVASLEPLDPNTTYVFGNESDYNNNERDFAQFVCFAGDAMVDIKGGRRHIDALAVGDRVLTRDNGYQRIRWIGRRSLSAANLHAAPHLRPIRVRRGAFGATGSYADLLVSPQHRMLIRSARCNLLFGTTETLAPAKGLIGDQAFIETTGAVTYTHFLFDAHEVVCANGFWSESFLPGPTAVSTLDQAQRRELCEIFPELDATDGLQMRAARTLIRPAEAALLS